ncbi:hypothetical protein [Thermoanaerobacter sp. A7A]|uniref:hypothetical protein n=1 Tax=Thermoanaerobacter sp. A7A TaxID=1350366 RepID=UPI0003FE1262|nr:hypothetical protein [Thermoanaerobacter sp. A7A]
MTINTIITSAPPAPQRSNPDTFADLADAFVSWLGTLDDQLNQWASEVNTTQSEINQNKIDTETARDIAYKWANENEDTQINDGIHTGYSAYHWSKKAELYKTQAEKARDLAAINANATVYDPNTTYNYPDAVIGSDGDIYRCMGTDVVGDDPTISDSNNWKKISDADTLDGYHAGNASGNIPIKVMEKLIQT